MDMVRKYNCTDVANFIVEKINEYNKQQSFQNKISLTNRRLNLLLYFLEIEYMKRNNGTPLLENFKAWPHGPTIPSIVSKFAQLHNGQMVLWSTEKTTELTEDIKAIIYEVLEVTKNIDTQDLISISNVVGGPWQQIYNENDNLHEQVISKETMYNYYLSRELFENAEVELNSYLKIKKR